MKPNRSTGIKGLSWNKNKQTYIVYEYVKGERIEHGSRRNFDEALELHRSKLGSQSDGNSHA